MLKNIKDSTLIFEEKRTLKWFLVLFFTISILYEGFYYFLLPEVMENKSAGMPSVFIYFLYSLLLILTVASYFIFRRTNITRVKYIVVLGYIVLSFINDMIIHILNPGIKGGGNIVEVFLILFSPIFISQFFFLVVCGSIIVKYTLVGIITQDIVVLILPVMLVVIISSIAFLLLKRILGYVDAIKNSYNKQLEGIVKGIIATLELKDPYTKGHSERVAFYALSLAKKLNVYSKEQLDAFYYACLLHDIGKIHIPDRILMKPDKLTREEFEIIKTHPAVGAEAVEKVQELSDSLNVILSHHERWDGKGYPQGLQRTEIPLAARITAIADAFDAMTSTRSYREALSTETAYKRILEGQGTQFDPDLIHIFQEVFPEWVELKEESNRSTSSVTTSYQELINNR
ncbi:HD-GYP domain-containing protein [Rossellomorea vietnamensis]|uniref:HD-GYP domain-containing protein n=1 Tax=Rossellomorea vietnamensis TaxID=218284 RepID=A0A5D4MEZ1_9BACI|nr:MULTISPECIES: HD domain-containing phosphohydrolase [Bacillaceae]TYR99585.1 HD-GYP domain-containing protein [Rossellomorea vietnamensis]